VKLLTILLLNCREYDHWMLVVNRMFKVESNSESDTSNYRCISSIINWNRIGAGCAARESQLSPDSRSIVTAAILDR
jgi:hypothetical protein